MFIEFSRGTLDIAVSLPDFYTSNESPSCWFFLFWNASPSESPYFSYLFSFCSSNGKEVAKHLFITLLDGLITLQSQRLYNCTNKNQNINFWKQATMILQLGQMFAIRARNRITERCGELADICIPASRLHFWILSRVYLRGWKEKMHARERI